VRYGVPEFSLQPYSFAASVKFIYQRHQFFVDAEMFRHLGFSENDLPSVVIGPYLHNLIIAFAYTIGNLLDLAEPILKRIKVCFM
jgi:hypothetical protein